MDDDVVAELPIPVVDLLAVGLEPRSYLSKSSRVEKLDRLVSFGEPVLTPLPPASIDGGVLQPYLEQQAATSAFYLLYLVVSLRPDDKAPIEKLGVGVELDYPDGPQRDGPAPTAWSLSPQRTATATTVDTTVGLNSSLRLVQSHLIRAEHIQQEELQVVGLGEREASFEWRFTSTRGRVLVGPHHMYAVIKAATNATICADILISASVRTSRLGLILYRADLSPRQQHVTWPPQTTPTS